MKFYLGETLLTTNNCFPPVECFYAATLVKGTGSEKDTSSIQVNHLQGRNSEDMSSSFLLLDLALCPGGSEDEEEVFRLSFGTRELLLGGLAGPPPLAFLLSPLAGAT